ncbi:hypothetical protein JCM10213_001801 [Rhodosporidiobolus nylandii]
MSYNPAQFYVPQPGGQGAPPPQAFPGGPPTNPQQFSIAALQAAQAQAQAQARQFQSQQQGAQGMPMQQMMPGGGAGAGPQFLPPGGGPGQQNVSAGGMTNMGAVEQLLRSGQLTPDQFAQLAAQIRQQQQQQAQRAAQVAPPQPAAPMFNPAPPAAAAPPPVPGGDKLPFAVLQQHFAQIAQVRQLSAKQQMLQQAVATGVLGQQPLQPAQRPLIQNQLEEAKRLLQSVMGQVQGFQAVHGVQRITADWQWHQQNSQRPQQNPPQPPPPQPQPPPPAGPTAAQQQQQLFQQRQAQAQAQAAAIAAARVPPLPTPQPPLPQYAPPPAAAGAPKPAPPPVAAAAPAPLPIPISTAQMPPLHLLQTQLNPQLFMKSLFEVMRKRGEPIEGTPFVEGREVDLYQLYQRVMAGGGSQQVTNTGTWHLIAAQLGWPVDASTPSLRDAPQETQRISIELARTYQSLLRPFEDVWAKSLVKQQQQIMEQQQRVRQASGATQTGSVQAANAQLQQHVTRPPSAQAQAQAPPPAAAPARPPSRQPQPIAPAPPQPPQSQNQNQNQLQAKAPAKPAGGEGSAAGGAGAGEKKEPTMEQIAEARMVVQGLKSQLEGGNRPNIKLVDVPEKDRQQVALLTHELQPSVKRVVEMLPVFYAITGDQHAVRKMLTFSAIFQDQMRHIGSGQFALDLSGLHQLKEQFQRCWTFMREHAARGRSTAGGAAAGQQQQQPPPGMTKEQFAATSLKAGLKVEDLKPPPTKRRTASEAGSPAASGSPAAPAGSPPSQPQSGGARGRPSAGVNVVQGKGKVPTGPVGGGGGGAKKESASPAPSAVPSSAPPPPPPAQPAAPEPPSLKRKREAEEIERDPDGFVERALRRLGGIGGVRGVGGWTEQSHLGNGLGLDFGGAAGGFDAGFAIPPVIGGGLDSTGTEKPLSFSTLASGSPYTALPPSSSFPSTSHTAAAGEAADDAFDFSFYIDSSAAGFDLPDSPAPQTSLSFPPPAESASSSPASPQDGDEAATPALTATTAPTPATPADVPTPARRAGGAKDECEGQEEGDVFYAANGEVVEDLGRWILAGSNFESAAGAGATEESRGGEGKKDGLPATFDWEKDMATGMGSGMGVDGWAGEGWGVWSEF